MRALTWPRRMLPAWPRWMLPEDFPVVLRGPGPAARRVLEFTGAADGGVIDYPPPRRRPGLVIG